MKKLAQDNLSILICTARRPLFLKELIESIDAAISENFAFNIEIVVVYNDRHSSAQSIVTLTKKLTSIPIQYINEAEPNISVARNTAIKHAKHDLCLFLDDDQLVERNFFNELSASIAQADRDFAAIRLPIAWQYENRVSTPIKLALEGHDAPLTNRHLTPLKRTEMGTGGLLFRLDRFKGIAPLFDQLLGRSGGEDIDFFLRSRERGHKFLFAAKPRVIERVTSNRATAAYSLKTSFRKGFVDAKLKLKNESLSQTVPYFVKTFILFTVAIANGVFKSLIAPKSWLSNLNLIWRQCGKFKALFSEKHTHYKKSNIETSVLHLTGGGQDGGAEKIIEQISSHSDKNQVRLSFFFYDTASERNFSKTILANGHKAFFYKKFRSLDWDLWRQLLKFVRSERISIIHTHDLGAMLHARIAKFFIPHLKLIHTEHTLHYWIDVPKYRRLYKWLSKSFVYVAGVSNYVKNELETKVGVSSKILRVVPNGVDVELFKSESSQHVSKPETLKIVAVSRIDANKNLQRVLHGVALARQRGITLQFTHVGTGSAADVKELEEIVEDLDLSSVVHFAGYSTNIPPLIEQADCFISASKVECHPVSVLEAMASGKPCILSNIPPHKELEQNGIILFEDNNSSLADALETVLSQHAYFDAFAQTLFKSASKSFSMPVMMARYSALYGSV
jgi:glycosyltransferase involved in cell wall biosynthesis